MLAWSLWWGKVLEVIAPSYTRILFLVLSCFLFHSYPTKLRLNLLVQTLLQKATNSQPNMLLRKQWGGISFLCLYTVPCDNIPTFNLTIGGRGFPIDPKILNQGRINGTNDCVSGLAATTNASAYKRLVSDVLPLTLRVQTSGSSEAFSSKMFIPPSIPPRRP